ncbi:tetratricopeptide repeat protein [Microbacterium sp. CFBP9034]|uniref:tetratricopeptide repeat protein n=1 Tax=Microbacterium sp. CFBP9034 TaxID=3096540 RepID=UPI002A69FBF2|nr:tetratricopeptide repeat protein [Microbacterium sp. CFBP9034]MDY0909593.1 tetratricopeptide repeat protein [Microbacterium sp. CFBP9034]
MTDDWDTRIARVWADDALDDLERVRAIDEIAAERPAHDPRALFERAGARDSAGIEEEAEPLYRAALDGGLDGELRTQAVIQLASTVRNLGKVDEALALLRTEYEHGHAEPLHDGVAAFYALALVSSGDAVRGASIALEALAPHLPRYTRSVAGYARELVDPEA